MKTEPETVRVLLAEDDSTSRDLVTSMLEMENWAPPQLAEDGVEALEFLDRQDWDILVSDLNMPRMGGEELILEALKRDPDLTVIVITGNGTIDSAVKLMKRGVFDFITKPFTIDRFLVAMEKARERVLSFAELRGVTDVVDALLQALESKDRYLIGHAARVSTYSLALGRLLGVVGSELKTLHYAAKLHDVGKIGVHEDILNKAGPLSAQEFEIMKRHPGISRDIIAPVKFLEPCLDAVYHHHERIDGRGYPEGIGGEEIPFLARIISVGDTFDAMNSDRAYRPALPQPRILEILREVAGTQLDSEIVGVFLDRFEEITSIPLEVIA